MKIKKFSEQGGHARSVPAYYAGQNAQGSPNHFETSTEAARLVKTRKAQSINRGKAILIFGPRKSLTSTRSSTKSGWKVVDQTQKNALRPGYPHYGSV